MIQFFRRALSSWLVLGLLGLVLIAFVVTGVQDPFGGTGGGGRGAALARVGDAQVTENEFGQIWQRAVEQARQRDPNVTGETLARAGAADQLFNELVLARSVEAFGRSRGLRAGVDIVDAEIRANPGFQLAGRFDQTAYEAALRAQRLTDRQLREALGGDLIRRQVLQPIGVPADAPLGQAEPYARILLERKEGLIGVVPAALMQGAPAPTEQQLRAFYDARRRQLTIPERRSFRYALIDPAVLAARVTVTDADVQRFYAANPQRFGATERRRVLQAALPDRAAAERLVQAVRGGEGFEAAAGRIAQLARADLDLGALTRAELAAAASEPAAAAVFALAQGRVRPVETPFGWRVYRVEAVERGAGRPLAAVRAEIETELRRTRGAALEAEVADQAQRALEDGAGFEETARKLGLNPVAVPPVTRDGRGAPGFQPTPAVAPLIESAFNAEPGEDPTVEDLGQGRAPLFAMGEVTPPTLPPFAGLRPALEQLWVADWRARRAAAVAAEVAQAVRGGASMAAELGRRGLGAPQQVGGRRIDLAQQPRERIPPPILLFLDTAAGAVRTQPAPGGQGSFVVQVVRATPAAAAEAAPLLADARRQFGAQAADELAQQFAQAARAEVRVAVNQPRVAELTARLAGRADPAAAQ